MPVMKMFLSKLINKKLVMINKQKISDENNNKNVNYVFIIIKI